MGKLTIKDSDTAIDEANLLLRCADSFSSIVNTMTTAKNSLEGEWISDAKNKQTISGNLNVTIGYYTKNIIEALNKLGTAISTYVNNVKQVSSNKEGSQGSVGVASPSTVENPTTVEGTNVGVEVAGINDSTAYERGTSGYTYSLEAKLGGADTAQWGVVDEMYLYFKDKGLTDEQIAGVLGNAAQESGFIVDIKNSGSSAKGLFQWINNTIMTNEGVVEPNQPPAWDLQTQLDHAWHQINVKDLSGRGDEIINRFNVNTTVDSATRDFAKFFEGYSGELDQRLDYANQIYCYIKNKFYI